MKYFQKFSPECPFNKSLCLLARFRKSTVAELVLPVIITKLESKIGLLICSLAVFKDRGAPRECCSPSLMTCFREGQLV